MRLSTLIKIITAALAAAALCPPVTAAGDSGKPLVELYVMSQCPYGTQAEDALFPVLKDYAKQVEFKVGFIGDKADGPAGKFQFESLHGQPEVEENIRQLCARELAPDKWLDYVLARNKDIKAADWEKAAAAAGIDPGLLADCSKGPGINNYIDNLALAKAKNAEASPTIYIGGENYTGPRTRDGFEWSVCSALRAKGAKPTAACAKLLAGPKPAGGPGGGGADCGAPAAPFNIRVVTEKDCKFCAPPLLAELKQNHPSTVISIVDSASKEGQELIKLHKARTLPFYVLDKAVEKEAAFKGNLDNFYSPSAGAYVFKPGPKAFGPSVQLGRPPAPGHLDIFVEALSPDSMQAASDLMAILTASPEKLKDLTLSWHLLTQEAPVAGSAEPASPGGSKKMVLGGGAKTRLTSSRGEAEVTESLRQACLFQYEAFATFMTYLDCRYYNLADMGRSWQCYKAEGKVKDCIEGGEGEKLLRADARFASGLEARAPALLWENRYGPFLWGSVDLNELIGWKH